MPLSARRPDAHEDLHLLDGECPVVTRRSYLVVMYANALWELHVQQQQAECRPHRVPRYLPFSPASSCVIVVGPLLDL